MTTGSKPEHTWRKLAAVMAAAGVIGLAGCNDSDSDNGSSGGDGDSGGDDVTESDFNWEGGTSFSYDGRTPGEISQESDADYNNNENGLITGTTLDGWIDDWAANKPDGVDGDLVILQVSTSYTDEDDNTSYHYIDDPDPATDDVQVYAIDTDRLTETRSNGVIETRSMVPSGAKMDQFLKDYDIDPTSDMIVWAMGVGGAYQNMVMGRGWYMMRYWGTPQENLAVLSGGANHSDVMSNVENGLNQENTRDDAAACDENLTSACLPGDGTVSVADLPENNFALQATLQDVMAVARGDVDAFIWDARSPAEYMSNDAFKNGGAKQGHPNGAAVLSFSNLLVADDSGANTYDVGGAVTPGASYRYKSKADLEDYVAGQEVDGARFQRNYSGSLGKLQSDDVYDLDGDQTSITYCETTYRAMITGIASAVVLGMPNRFYDGAMVEWNSMANIQDKNGEDVLPKDSPWRTDKDELSFYEYNDPANIEPRTIDDAQADSTTAIIEADRNYGSN